jgi:cytochrome c oxidase assembly protein subunit 15
MALVIVGLLLSLLIKNKKVINTTNNLFTFLTIVSLVFTLIQIVLGTQVREFVDEQVKLIGYDKTNWLTGVPLRFYIHRTFSLLVLAVNIYLFYINSKFKLGFNKINLVIFLIGVEIITGIFMYYFDFPFLTQPIHLVIATLLFGAQFYILLECIKRKKNDL